ncbi:MAG: hypothetical protein LBL07_01115 [Tannerella sp.]|jgi:hypothetical protein|nr:hypothetical protein [Tannerella sp.]
MIHKSLPVAYSEDSQIAASLSCTANFAEGKKCSHSICSSLCTVFHTLYICSRTGSVPARFFYSPAESNPWILNYSTPDNSITENHTCFYSIDFSQNVSGFSRNTSGFSQNTSGFSQNVSGFSQNVSGFSQNVSGFSQNTSGFSQNVSGFNQNTSGFSQNVTDLSPQVMDFSSYTVGNVSGVPGHVSEVSGNSLSANGFSQTININTSKTNYEY